ncbi:hypothetical protein CK203_047322 [Vitis vinifera]|uniref:Reverse transcriptase domain-containing protein n=1 Tax=Vitis vinifera TaxID=29760 RepID=A0A438HHM4_VITVI|nr:hypothetical protein CK203_047322 [Vitis vinifera]
MLAQKMTSHCQSSSLWLMNYCHEALSFMDGSSGYNQIRMAPRDEELMHFILQRKIFDDMLHKNVKCYVDDLVVKSRKREDHLRDLCMVFDRVYCSTPWHWDQSKIATIRDMLELRNLQELRSLQGHLAFIDGAPMAGKPLILYIAAQECSLGALLAQENEENKEMTLYYSRRKCDFPDEEIFYVGVFPLWMMFFDWWSSFRRPRVASSLAVEESNNGFGKPMGVRHVSREYEKGYKPLRGAEERMLFGCQLQERVGAAIRDFLERVWCFFERSWREVLDAGREKARRRGGSQDDYEKFWRVLEFELSCLGLGKDLHRSLLSWRRDNRGKERLQPCLWAKRIDEEEKVSGSRRSQSHLLGDCPKELLKLPIKFSYASINIAALARVVKILAEKDGQCHKGPLEQFCEEEAGLSYSIRELQEMHSHSEVMESYTHEFCRAMGCPNFAKECGEAASDLGVFVVEMKAR